MQVAIAIVGSLSIVGVLMVLYDAVEEGEGKIALILTVTALLSIALFVLALAK